MDAPEFLRRMAGLTEDRLHDLVEVADSSRGGMEDEARRLAEAIREDAETVLMVLDRGGA